MAPGLCFLICKIRTNWMDLRLHLLLAFYEPTRLLVSVEFTSLASAPSTTLFSVATALDTPAPFILLPSFLFETWLKLDFTQLTIGSDFCHPWPNYGLLSDLLALTVWSLVTLHCSHWFSCVCHQAMNWRRPGIRVHFSSPSAYNGAWLIVGSQ